MLDVYYTIDTEFWLTRDMTCPKDYEEDFDRDIYGRTSRGDYGLDFQLKRFTELGLKANCFVETTHSLVLGIEPLQRMVDIVKTHGHDVQLHCHTEWLTTHRPASPENAVLPPFPSPIQDGSGQHIRHFSESDQAFVIAEGIAALHRVHLPDSMETLLASMDKGRRTTVNRKINRRFLKMVKDFRLERITGSSQIENFFDIMEKIDVNSWQGKTFGLPNRKTESQIEYWKKIADTGFVRSYILWVEGKPIAYFHILQYDGICYGHTTAYDPSYAELAPGIVCFYYFLDDLMTHDPMKIYDCSFGTHVYKRLFGNEEIESTIVFIAGSTKGKVLAFLQRFLNRFVFRAKGLLQKWNIADRIRKILKHKK